MRSIATTILLAACAAALLYGCTDEGSLLPNQPPETLLVVDDTELDTTHYIQTLSWHGEDHDGEVLRFEYKWTLADGTTAGDFDTTWVGLVEPFVTVTRDTFFLPVPTVWADTLTHHFQVRAVDDEGAVDATPASARIRVFNQAPRLYAIAGGDTSSTLVLPESILPVLSFQFRVIDPDNPLPDQEDAGAYIDEFRFWFEDSLDYMSLPPSDTLLTVRPEEFGEQVGMEREFHLQAVDLGGAMSNVLAASTFVQDVTSARVLVLDSADSFSPSVSIVDPFWHDEVAGLLPADEVYLHDFEADGPLVHPDHLHLIFSLFEAVLWYNGGAGSADNTSSSEPTPEISEAETGLRAYLEGGGKVLLSSYNLIGASVSPISGGSLSAEFETEVLLTDSLFVHVSGTPDNLPSSNWRVWPPTAEIPGFPAVGTETLRNATALRGIDRMSLQPTALADGVIEELYFLPQGSFDPPSADEGGSVGVRRYFDSGGELVLLTFPISLAGGYDNNLEQMERFLTAFGVTP